MTKAFDSINYSLLLKKLERYGVRGTALELFSSYLTNRVQRVRLDGGIISENRSVTAGIPQGSILGPTLFIIFINDLHTFLKHHLVELICYADDSNILVSGSTFHETMSLATNVLQKFLYWTNENKLRINADKSVAINFSCRFSNNNEQQYLSVDSLKVPITDSARLLGLVVDSTLRWTEHINFLCNYLARCCYAIKTIKQHVTSNAVRTLYFACFQSHLKFSLIHWGGSTHWLRVFRLQKRSIRIIAGLGWRDSCRSSFISYKILTLPSLYIYELCCFVFRNRDMFEKK